MFDLYGLTAAERRLNVAVPRAREQMVVILVDVPFRHP